LTHRLRVSRSASRQIAEELPEAVAAAIIEFITGPLIESPERVGGPLHHELDGRYAARRGTFRIIYRIDEPEHAVYVEWIMARSDVYKSR
jgi:mRNA-degrading endonuclease RelE of RelBE toxin-antitoxin system